MGRSVCGISGDTGWGTGHGGIMAVRQMVEDCIREGIADERIDDQPIEGKWGTGTTGVEIQSLDVMLTRYRAAVDRKRELARTSW